MLKKIPRVIHKIIILDDMKTPEFDDSMKSAIQSFKTHNPDYEIRIYNGEDCIEYIKKHYSDRELNSFMSLGSFAYKADFMRMLILYNEGGIYSDMRQVCLIAFDDYFPEELEWYTPRDRPGCPLNSNRMAMSIILSVPKNQWFKNAIDLINDNVKNKYYGGCPLCPTGPCLFGKAIDMSPPTTKVNHIGFFGMARDDHCEYCFSNRGEKLILNKYKKPNNQPYQGGEWVGKGNNYNVVWYTKNVYKN